MKAMEAKSDQMNAIDLIAGPKTVEITSVKVLDTDDQPVHVFYNGDGGKPYKPCKGMIRAIATAWGDEGDNAVGKKMTLFREPTVKWGGADAGGIHISHMTGLKGNSPMTIMLRISRSKSIPFTVQPLITEPENVLTDDVFDGFAADMSAAKSMADLSIVAKSTKSGNFDEAGRARLRETYDASVEAIRTAQTDEPK